MLARVGSGALVGVDALVVEVEIDMSLGLPYFNVVGLPDGAAKESKVRVISALKNTGFELPSKRITVNLAPADLRKEGAAFELPIAIGVLVAARMLDEAPISPYLIAGELSLDGGVKAIRGVLSLALLARNRGYRGIIVPAANGEEAALVDRIEVIPVAHLREAVDHLTGAVPIVPLRRETPTGPIVRKPSPLDMADVRGQADLKHSLEMAAAGGHNVLMCGAPGSGKTMLARRLPGILPSMTLQEALEVTQIHSVVGLMQEGSALATMRPFRSPHHTISDAGLVGGGPMMRPGELSLAHNGVLFLDEFPEFKKNVLEILRQPLEEGRVHLARANHHVVFPCRVMLVAAMNPCPCGWFNVPGRTCVCKDYKVFEYHQRVSGPLMDRIDLTLQSRPVTHDAMVDLGPAERTSAWYRDRIEAARERQRHRFRDLPDIHCNAQMGPRELHRFCKLDSKGAKALAKAVKTHGFSARAHDRIIKVARTRADLEGREDIHEEDVYLAIDCRILDRRGWLNGKMIPDRPEERRDVKLLYGSPDTPLRRVPPRGEPDDSGEDGPPPTLQ